MPRKADPNREKCVSVAISFEPEQYRELISYCERNDRSMAWVVRQALKRWLEEHKGDHI